MNALVCAVTIVYCVHGVEVRDAQSERIWSNRADLHKSASDYEISDAENLAHSSALGRYSPNFRNSRLNLHGRRAPDFRPAINSRLNKGLISFDKLTPIDSSDLGSVDPEDPVANFPRGLSRGIFDSSDSNTDVDTNFFSDENNFKVKKAKSRGKKSELEFNESETYNKGSKVKDEVAGENSHNQQSSGLDVVSELEDKDFAKSSAAVKGQKSSDEGQSDSRRKGHKTSGFHKVYKKDEYKKDTTFYDDEHVSHHEESRNSELSGHENETSQLKKTEDLDSRFHQERRDGGGFFTNGHQYGSALGHELEGGHRKTYEDSSQTSQRESRSK